MKIREVTAQIVQDYLRVSDEESYLNLIRDAAFQYIRSFTGLTEEQMDEHEDLSIALLVLCAELYDNRQMSVDNGHVNPVIEQILASHSVNYL